jgi:outer membrane protein TolC
LVTALLTAPLSLDSALQRTAQAPGVRQNFAAVDIKRDMNRHLSPLADGLQIAIQPGWRFLPAAEKQFQMGLSVTQPFRLSAFGTHRKEGANFEASALEANARLNAFQREVATTAAWFSLWEGWQQLHEVEQAKVLAERLLVLVARAAALGVLSASDEAEAQVFLSEAELQRLAAEGEVWDRSAQLAKAMGEAMTEPITVTDEIDAAPTAAALKAARQLAQCHPEVQQDRALAAASRSKEREEASYRASRFDVGVAAYYDNPRGLVTFLNFGVDLGLFDRGERERGSALAQARLAEGRATDAERAATTTLTLFEHEIEHRAEVQRELSTRLLPSLERLDQQNERRLSAGDITVFELLQGRRRLLATRTRLRTAEAQLGSARQVFARYFTLLDHCTEQKQ